METNKFWNQGFCVLWTVLVRDKLTREGLKDWFVVFISVENRNLLLNCLQTEKVFWEAGRRHSSCDCKSLMMFVMFLYLYAGTSQWPPFKRLILVEHSCSRAFMNLSGQSSRRDAMFDMFSGFYLKFTDIRRGSKSLDLWVKWNQRRKKGTTSLVLWDAPGRETDSNWWRDSSADSSDFKLSTL